MSTGTDAVVGQGFGLSVTLSVSPFSTINIGQLRTAKLSGSKTKVLDISNTDSPSAYEETIPGMIAPGDLDFSGVFGPDDSSHVELRTLQDARTKNNWTIQLPDKRGNWTFSAFVSELSYDTEYDKPVTFSGKLSISGPVTWTADV